MRICQEVQVVNGKEVILPGIWAVVMPFLVRAFSTDTGIFFFTAEKRLCDPLRPLRFCILLRNNSLV